MFLIEPLADCHQHSRVECNIFVYLANQVNGLERTAKALKEVEHDCGV